MRNKILPFFVLVLLILPFSLACNSDEKLVIECAVREELLLNKESCISPDCSINTTENIFGGIFLNLPYFNDVTLIETDRITMYHPSWEGTEQLSRNLDILCDDMDKEILPVIEGALSSYGYDMHVHQKNQETKSSLTECQYEELVRYGNWILSTNQTRPYCVEKDPIGDTCPYYKIDRVQFFWYLLMNPSDEGGKLLPPYILFFMSILVLFILLYKNGYLQKFLYPRREHYLMCILLGIPTLILTLFVLTLIEFIFLIFAYYLLASLINYSYTKITFFENKNKNKKVEKN